MLYDLTYFFNGVSLMFFLMAAVHTTLCARKSGSRPHGFFAACLFWMVLIEAKEFVISYDPTYDYEILGPGYTLPDIFTLPLLSLFFFELVMPGRITLRYALKLLAPFLLLAGTYLAGLSLYNPVPYRSPGALAADLPSFLPTVLLLYVVYGAGYCVFALYRIVVYSIRYAEQIAQAYSFTERIHLRWMRWMSALLAIYLIFYILIISFASSPFFTLCIYWMTLGVWGVLYSCIMQYRIPEIISNYWQPEEQPKEPVCPEETSTEKTGRIATLYKQVTTAMETRKLYLDPGLTIIDLATECGTNRTHLSQFFNNELGISFRDYINRCRIDHATQLLEQYDYKFEELALVAGFGSTTTFYRAFAKEKGMTPQQWLESHTARGGAETYCSWQRVRQSNFGSTEWPKDKRISASDYRRTHSIAEQYAKSDKRFKNGSRCPAAARRASTDSLSTSREAALRSSPVRIRHDVR